METFSATRNRANHDHEVILLQIFHKDITAVEITPRYVAGIKSRKSRGILRFITPLFFYEEVNGSQKIVELRENLIPDVEDIVVVNFPNDDTLFVSIDIPPTLKNRDLAQFAKMEVARLLNLSVDNMSIDVAGKFSSKCMVTVAKQRDLNEFINRILQAGFPEPDVVLPDLFKYFELIYIPEATAFFLIFTPDYGAAVLSSGGSVLGVRTFSSSTWEILDIVSEETGIPRLELMNGYEAFEKNQGIGMLVESILSDLPYTVERELIFLLNTVLPNSSLNDVSRVFVMSDPDVLQKHFVKAFSALELLQEKIEPVVFRWQISSLPLGILGISVRGGREFGKNKLVQE